MTKFTQAFKDLLLQHFSEVLVVDERGDGHHLELVCIDDVFSEMNRLARSRHIFACLTSLTEQIHAMTVKAFTKEEWEEKKSDFEATEYVHFKN